ncbi:right-handed parallel beta-helix repeat-containing protein [Polyangium aurulentum]|uniref:right-handed parallel beta-helix repeat-containing protein n=1 Tax=Polyangium aurulentum TaxID=2567896 RepID=UPI0010AEC768|nr:right-handed parallel beta-helix repeat-containing protein [Polyangium aurulentum]UQA55606.1 right-handed parallel beta-helix repeat-containing protein [Polyangium aurulentum]
MIRNRACFCLSLLFMLSCSRKALPGGDSVQQKTEPAPPVAGPPRMLKPGLVGPAERRPEPPAGGRRFYVSPKGNDVNDCSEQSPCRELKRGVKLATAPGDVLIVEDGEYAGFAVSDVSGEPGRPITIFAKGKRAIVKPDPECNGKWHCRDTIIVRRSKYVVLDGLTANEAMRSGVAIFYGDHITVRNGVYGDNGRWGIFSSFADDLVIENNEVYRSHDEHGIYLSNSGDRPIVRANVARDNNACGIQINADYREKPEFGKSGKSWYVGEPDGLTTGAVIENNLIYGNGSGQLGTGKKRRRGGAGINLDGVQDSIVRGNVLFDNQAGGIVAYGDADGLETDEDEDGDGRFGPKGMVIAHNTVVMPSGSRHGLQIRLSAGSNIVRNNILTHEDKGRAGLELVTEKDAQLVDSDGNVLDRVAIGEQITTLDDWKKKHGKDAHSLSVPLKLLFADRARGDFTLVPGSPAARAGTQVNEVAHDYFGKPWRSGGGRSIGACESDK